MLRAGAAPHHPTPHARARQDTWTTTSLSWLLLCPASPPARSPMPPVLCVSSPPPPCLPQAPPAQNVDAPFLALAQAFQRNYEEKATAFEEACRNF